MDPEQVRRARQALGRRLAAFRQAAGHTQQALAPLIHYHRSTIANVETGRQRVPREFWRRCDEVLHTGGSLTVEYDDLESLAQQLCVAKARQHYPRSRDPIATAHGSPSFAGQSGELYGGIGRAIMTAAQETSEHAMDAGAWAVSEATVEQLRDDAARLARSFSHLPPAHAVSETLRMRDLATGLLERTRRPAQQTELYLVAAQAAALLASESIDLGLWPSAMQFARAAYTYGEVIGHNGVRAYARGMQATVAYWTGRAEDAVEYAQAATELAPPGVARVRAQCVLSRAWAHRGSTDHVRRAIAAATDARADEGHDDLHDIIGGEFGYTPAQQARCDGSAWLQVKRPEEAAAAACRALTLNGSQASGPWPTVQAEAHVDLAICHVLNGDIDAVEETLAPLWAIPPDWRRIGLLGRVEKFGAILSAGDWRGVTAARHVAERAESFVAARPAHPALPPA